MRPLITDLAEIARLTKLREDKSFDFRAQLKRGSQSDNELDKIVHRVYLEVSSQIDCRSCANCCRVFDIVLSNDDVATLAKACALDTTTFSTRYLAAKLPVDDGPCINSKPCPFLQENSCSKYSDRPAVCREFPHLEKEEFATRTLAMIANCATCPIVFNTWERLKDQLHNRRRKR